MIQLEEDTQKRLRKLQKANKDKTVFIKGFLKNSTSTMGFILSAVTVLCF